MHLTVSRATRFVRILAILAGAMLGCGLAAAQDPVALTLSPADTLFVCPDPVEISVQVDAAATDLLGFSLILDFDPDVIEPQTVAAGALLTDAACDHFFQWIDPLIGSGVIEFDGAALGCLVDGPGEIARITFVGVGEGTTSLSFRPGDIRMRDGENATIPVNASEATIQYICPVATETRDWSALKRRFE